MDRWLNVFLKNYAPDEKETFLRARFSTIAILCILLTTSATIIYTTFLYGPFSTLVLMEMCGLLVMLVALGILVKGNYFIAVHTIFITGFATLWLVMFIDSSSSMLIKMDTIVFIIGLFAAMPIILSKSLKPILIYFSINLIIFLIFNYHLKQIASLSLEEHVDYLMDNLVVMAFVCLATSTVFMINQKALTALKIELDERKKTQERMIQSEKMMSVGGLAAGMAHEINNPLAGIMQNSQLIYSRLTQAMPANDKVAADLGVSMAVINSYMTQRGILKQLQSIHHASQRITQIIENMLTFSKKSDLQRKESDPITLMENTLALLKNDPVLNHRQHGHSIEIIREYASCLPKVFCETSKIQQVMFNLFKNAVESMNAKTYDNDAPQLTIRLKSGQGWGCRSPILSLLTITAGR